MLRCGAVLVVLGGGLGGTAAWAAGEPAWTAGRAHLYLEGAPGAVLEDRLTVTNPGAKPLTVRLAPAEAYNTASGELAVRAARDAEATGAWISLATTRLTVPPRTRAEVPFSVTVPPDALPGDHPGAITATTADREVGVRIHLRVSGPTLAALTVENVSYAAGAIRYTLVNRGNTALTPTLTVSVDGLFGKVLSRPARALPVELLPAQRVTLTEPWAKPPSLDSVDIRLKATAAGDAKSTAVATANFIPWTAVGLSALGLAAGASAWLFHRHSTRSKT
ncbi:hypothetical protein AB0M39_23025 [Streptomyces sp. NPDC051907]|uniref:COG1470 family protein n=1 Tax=Streptomyces sp. NPDC051907 TaxID=3155284 RepID=UPI00343ECF8F